MATIRKIKRKNGIVWKAEVRRRGVSDYATFDSREEAVSWAANREHEVLHSIGVEKVAPDYSFQQAVDRYLAEVVPLHRGSSKEDIRLKRIAQNSGLASYPLRNITTAMLAQWRDKRSAEVSAASVIREMTTLRSMFEIARREWQWIETNPMRDVSRPKKPRARDRLIKQAEIDAIVAELGWQAGTPPSGVKQFVAVMFLLAIETAMRAGELLSLTWEDVDLVSRVASLSETKNGDARQVPLSSRAVELFGYLPRVDARCLPINPGTRDTVFRRAVIACGIKNLHFHDSRAEALTRLSRKVDVLTLARIVGHRDPRSLMVYYRESASDIAARLG